MDQCVGQLIDPSNFDQYSMRTLRYMCTKNKIQIPLNPNRDSMIKAILQYQKPVAQKPKAKPKRKITNPNKHNCFSTPPIPITKQTISSSAFPTPILPKDRSIYETPAKPSVSPMLTPTLASTPAPLKENCSVAQLYIKPLLALVCFFLFILVALFVVQYCKL